SIITYRLLNVSFWQAPHLQPNNRREEDRSCRVGSSAPTLWSFPEHPFWRSARYSPVLCESGLCLRQGYDSNRKAESDEAAIDLWTRRQLRLSIEQPVQ